MFKISVSMIVKNEEEIIEKALKSVKDFEEIVITDTGSDDDTFECAQKYTNKTFHFSWIDDFSVARNFSLDQCKNEWRLILDADDELEEGGLEKIQKVLNCIEPTVDAILFDIHFQDKFSHSQIRLIKKGVKYLFPIHEYPDAKRQFKSDIKIFHTSSSSHLKDPDRNLRILKNIIKKEPTARNTYYLASEYYYKGRYITAAFWFEKYLKIATFKSEKSDAYLLLAKCYWELSEGDQARDNCLKAILLNPDFKAALNFMAIISFPEQAKKWRHFAELATNKDVLFMRE